MSDYREGLDLLPRHMRDGVVRYIEHGLPNMGSFLCAVMENNLTEAFGRADEANTEAMKNWATFVYSYAPTGCHGSREKVRAWVDRGGLRGIEATSSSSAEGAAPP